MGKWLTQLRKNQETPGRCTDKTDKTAPHGVSSVLSVRPSATSDYFSTDTDDHGAMTFRLNLRRLLLSDPDPLGELLVGGSVSFVSSSKGHIPNYFSTSDRADWGDEDWQAAFDERAAVLEYDGCLPREEAEQLARAEIDGERRRWVQ